MSDISSLTQKAPHHPMWEKPVHHQYDPKKAHEVHWIELFYDLIHVVAIFMLGNYLTENLNLFGLGSFAFLFIALWVSWGDYVFYNSLYVSRDYKHRLLSALHITTVMVMAGSIPTILEGGLAYFSVAYGLNKILLATMYHRAKRYNAPSNTLAGEMWRNFGMIGVVMLVSGFLPFWWNAILLSGGILALQASYLMPKYGTMRFANFTPRLSHLSERFSLLLLICLGEGYFKMVLALGEKGFFSIGADIFLNYVLGGVVLFLLAWMYFDFRGNGEVRERAPKWQMAQWWYSHMLLMLSAVCIAVALKAEVKVHYYEPYPFFYGMLGCFGFILYLLSLESIQRTINNSVARKFANFWVKLLGIGLASLVLIVNYYELPSAYGNLLYMLAVGSQLVIPITRAYAAFRGEVEQMHEARREVDRESLRLESLSRD